MISFVRRAAFAAGALLAIVMAGHPSAVGAQDAPTSTSIAPGVSGPTIIGPDGNPTVTAPSVGQAVTSPTIALDHYEVVTDSHVLLTVSGFRSPFVHAAVCGNAARRGSGDCNVRGTKTIQLDRDGAPATVDFIISVPPMPCPCLVRVSGDDNQEVAIAELRIIGHPSAPVVGSVALDDSIEASITASANSGGFKGWLRSSLGGSTNYDVKISLRNRSTEAVNISGLDAWSGRNANDVTVSMPLDAPGRIEPGASWEKVVQATLPAPVYGSATWQVEITSEGQPTLLAKSTTSHLPGLLIVLIIVLVVDLVALAIRVVARLKGRLEARPDRGEPANGPMATPAA